MITVLSSNQLLLSMLAGGMLVLGFFVTARMRLQSMVSFFAAQSFVLAVFAGVAAITRQEPDLLITVGLTFVLKVLFIPWLLMLVARRTGAIHRLQSYLRPATMLFCGSLLVLGAFLLTRSVVPSTSSDYVIAASSVSMVLLGLLMLVTRNAMYGQIIGFLLMENGIFTFGLTLTGGMPLLVELGVFLDVTVGAVLMSALAYRVHREHETTATDLLTELVD